MKTQPIRMQLEKLKDEIDTLALEPQTLNSEDTLYRLNRARHMLVQAQMFLSAIERDTEEEF